MAEQAVQRSLEGRRAAVTSEIGRLVDAALALIQRTGEIEPRVSEIVREAGLSNQAFYRHFRSKSELLVAVLDRGIALLASYLQHRMEGAATPTDRVREWVRGMLEQALSPQGAAATRPFVLARGRLSETFPQEVTRSEQQLTAPLRAAIAAAAAAGELPGANAEQDAEALYHLTMGWMQARILEGGGASRADAAALETFALAGLTRNAIGGLTRNAIGTEECG
jgi:AcrR family transcriptional regulator